MRGYATDYIPDIGVTLEQYNRTTANMGHPLCWKPQHSAPKGSGPGIDAEDSVGGAHHGTRTSAITPSRRPAVWAREDGFSWKEDK